MPFGRFWSGNGPMSSACRKPSSRRTTWRRSVPPSAPYTCRGTRATGIAPLPRRGTQVRNPIDSNPPNPNRQLHSTHLNTYKLGTSILISEDSGLKLGKGGVRCGIGQQEGDGEGRVMTIDLGSFSLVNVYTPNAGEGLKRLDFRVGTWDRAFEQHLKSLQQGGTHAVLCCGDLNVAHLDVDFFNPEEPRMEKQAGTTPQERASFGQLLGAADMVDTFRHYHPTATGCYSYFSMRAGNRPYNRGLRLDYFLASRNMLGQEGKGGGGSGMPRVVDSFILDQDPQVSKLSDHAPVGLLLEL